MKLSKPSFTAIFLLVAGLYAPASEPNDRLDQSAQSLTPSITTDRYA